MGLLTLFFLSSVFQNAFAQDTCDVVFSDNKPRTNIIEQEPIRLPDIVQDLKVVLPNQERLFVEKGKSYLAVDARGLNLKDPVYQRFQQESIELVLVSGSGGFKHMMFRVGEKIYDFGSLRQNRVGEEFRKPSPKTDVKGLAFLVGRDQIRDAQYALDAVYAGSRDLNNPPFSSVGGKLVIVDEGNGRMRFRSEERVWIPGGKKVNIDSIRNNQEFKGKIVEDTSSIDGKQKLYLENKYGIRIPVGKSDNGELFVNGLSCASSAVFVMKHIFGIQIPESKSAANLTKLILEGNKGFEATPDVVFLYGQEKKAPKEPFVEATLKRDDLLVKVDTKVDQSKAVVDAPRLAPNKDLIRPNDNASKINEKPISKWRTFVKWFKGLFKRSN